VPTLQQIIDNCNAGDSGMDKCPGLIGGINDPSTSCNIPDAIQETITGNLTALPGNNPIIGAGSAPAPPAPVTSSSTASSAATPATSSSLTSVNAAGYGSGYGTGPSTISAIAASPSSASLLAAVKSSTSSVGAVSTTFATHPVVTESPVAVASSATTVPVATETNQCGAPAISSLHVSGWAYIGCYSDNRDERALSGITFANLGIGKVTMTGCIAYCDANGFSLAGTEYAGQCFCDNVLVDSSPLSECVCNMKCEGDASDLWWRLGLELVLEDRKHASPASTS